MSRVGQQHYALASASIPLYQQQNSFHWKGQNLHAAATSSTRTCSIRNRRRHNKRIYPEKNVDCYSIEDRHALERTLPAARSKKSEKRPEDDSSSSSQSFPRSKNFKVDPNDPFASPPTTEEIYSNLSPLGYCLAGTVEIAVSTFLEYVQGFLGGYTLGSVVGMPGFVFKPVDPSKKAAFFQELMQRGGRMHTKSFRWAKTWGEVTAIFGGARVATRVIRRGKEDEWNTILSSAAAGAFFARKGRNLF